jgi:WS/DGAT/MGAT family acyltransferase
MQQLTGMDSSFLTMETPSQTGHVGSVYLFDPGATAEAVKQQLEQRLHLLPPYRRQLVEVPFDLDHPYWIESPNFDLDFHVREIGLPTPGDRYQLSEQISRLAARPLDRSRPLWEWYVIHGYESGDIVHYVKIHHATIDGASGTEAMTVLLDDQPDPPAPEPPRDPWKPEEVPTPAELLGRTFMSYATRPQRYFRAQMRLWQEMAARSRDVVGEGFLRQLSTAGRNGGTSSGLPTTPAPRTPFNASITPHRRWGYLTVSLDEVKRVKGYFGVTVNDVVLAVCAGALRRWLVDHAALPDDPLLAMCPISTRGGASGGLGSGSGDGASRDTYSNQVSAMVVSLATNVANPVERLQAINRSTQAGKEQFKAIPADVLQDFTQFAPPAVAAQASRMIASTRIADRMNPPINVTISNVPGPRHPLYLAGAALRHTYPVSIVTDGMGLNITCTSYMDSLDFGLISCRELIPDLWALTDYLADALGELSAAAP